MTCSPHSFNTGSMPYVIQKFGSWILQPSLFGTLICFEKLPRYFSKFLHLCDAKSIENIDFQQTLGTKTTQQEPTLLELCFRALLKVLQFLT